MMEYTNERDFKYVMQDTSHVFMGGRMTYEDMMTWEDVPFKIKAIINKHFAEKGESGLVETIGILSEEDFRYQILKQLKIIVMNTKNESYESPQVEIVEVQVEQGFAQSLENPTPGWDI